MSSAVVIGVSGGIGGGLARALVASGRYTTVHGLSRRPIDPIPGVVHGVLDITDEPGIAAAADRVGSTSLVIVATGVLQSEQFTPERTYRALDMDAMMAVYLANTVGPALIAKHFLPRLPKGERAIFAALSARVGSIADNRLGGWHSYRASKAALNMLIRNFALELARDRPEAICVGLHPGTVDTALSQPFQRGVRPDKLFTADHAAERLLSVLGGLSPADSGNVFAWDGVIIPP